MRNMADLEAHGAGGRYLAIVAHEDDDLLFLSPELVEGLRSGRPCLTVFVTAGEAEGDHVSREHYAAQRQAGIRAAYADAVGAPDDWTRVTRTHAGREIELAVLDAEPTVQAMFLCLPDGGDSLHLEAVRKLWLDVDHVESTLLPDDSPVPETYDYRQDDLLAVLVEIIDEFAPTVVRVGDSGPATDLFPDHVDHVAVASFARLATDVHAQGGARVTLIEHRAYNIRAMPGSLSPGRSDEKDAIFGAYRVHDANAFATPPEWLSRFYRKWEIGGAWATTDDSGLVHAFAVQGGAVRHWQEEAPGGPWTPPRSLDRLDLAPALAVARHSDGRIAVFGVHADTRDLYTSHQLSPGDDFSEWFDLGNHSGAANNLAPAVVPNDDGRLQVFLRNSGTGLSTIVEEDDESWSAWFDFGQVDLQGTPAAVLRSDGLGFVAMATRATVRTWAQETWNGGWSAPIVRADEGPSCSPSLAPGADDRLYCFYRTVDGVGRFIVEEEFGGDFSAPVDLGGDDGVDVIAAVRADGMDGRIFVAQRAFDGSIGVAWQLGPDDAFDDWVDLGGTAIGAPALVADPDGLPVLLMHAANGSLHVARLASASPVTWGEWEPAGG
jgi:LmbE family N-acetylglucosaminyl deacetylase